MSSRQKTMVPITFTPNKRRKGDPVNPGKKKGKRRHASPSGKNNVPHSPPRKKNSTLSLTQANKKEKVHSLGREGEVMDSGSSILISGKRSPFGNLDGGEVSVEICEIREKGYPPAGGEKKEKTSPAHHLP